MSTAADSVVALVVTAETPIRLDRFLAKSLAGSSRHHARELIAAGAVRVNGRRAAKAHPVKKGDVIHVSAGPMRSADGPRRLTPQPDLDVPILYEDAAVVALDKPAGMPSIALGDDDRGTLANFLVGRYPELARVSEARLEAGLAHRLDSGTSGVILAARTAPALQALRRQFRAHEIEKEYLALVAGDVALPGSIKHSIAHAPRRRQRMTVCRTAERARTLKARPAVTCYRPLERFGAMTLLQVRMRTGVRHQVRVHLASVGHPLVGDSLYNPAPRGPLQAERPLLHATRVTFRHPLTGIPMTVAAPAPSDLAAVLRRLRSKPRRRRPESGPDRSGERA